MCLSQPYLQYDCPMRTPTRRRGNIERQGGRVQEPEPQPRANTNEVR